MSAGALLHGVGVGPGDPELLTLKALRIISAADVIAYPQLGEQPSIARAIVAPHLVGPQREIAMRVPLTGGHETGDAYDVAASAIARELEAGKRVAVLCEGDPLLFGSFIAIWQRLSDKHACEIVPGISSVMAASARLQVALARADQSLAVIPGTLADEALASRIEAADSIVILKVGRHLQRLRALIGRLGLMRDALYIERATLENEQLMPLDRVEGDVAPYFSMIFIRKSGARAS